MEKYLFKFVICSIITFALSISVYGQANNQNEDNNLLTLNTNENSISSKYENTTGELRKSAVDGLMEEYKDEFNVNSSKEMQETLYMVAVKSKLMDEKMELINQKMLLAIDFLYTPRTTKADIDKYLEKMEKLDKAIDDTQIKIVEVNVLMSGIRKR